MQQQDNHEYPFLYQRQTCHQVQPNQATYQKRQKCQPATYLQEVLYQSNLKLLRRITRTENILHRNFTRRQVAIQNRVASNIGISQSTFSVKVLNLFSRSRRKTNKRKSKHSAMLRNKETRHRMFIGLLNTTRKLA